MTDKKMDEARQQRRDLARRLKQPRDEASWKDSPVTSTHERLCVAFESGLCTYDEMDEMVYQVLEEKMQNEKP